MCRHPSAARHTRRGPTALLLRRWEQTKEGEAQLVLVGGEPGIGKSRLACVFRERLSGESCFSLRYQCSPYHVNSALYPIVEHLECAAGFAREDSSEEKLDKMQAMLAGSEAQRTAWAPLVAALLLLPLARYSPPNSKLRATLGLARLLCERGEHQAACELLTPIFAWFREGFDTKDLKEAKVLLEKLGA
jgi:predicted ATPase